MSCNTTSKILTYTDPTTGMNGVILPHSSHVLFESDIDAKRQKATSHVKHLSNAQAHRTTHGGKRFRARQIALRDQADYSSKTLTLLSSAKEIITNLNQKKKPTLLQLLNRNSVAINSSLNLRPPKSYTEGQSISYQTRKITAIHSNY